MINTNFCNISVCKTKFKNKIIILSAIDNLKFNIDFTFEEYKKFLTNFNANTKYPDISK